MRRLAVVVVAALATSLGLLVLYVNPALAGVDSLDSPSGLAIMADPASMAALGEPVLTPAESAAFDQLAASAASSTVGTPGTLAGVTATSSDAATAGLSLGSTAVPGTVGLLLSGVAGWLVSGGSTATLPTGTAPGGGSFASSFDLTTAYRGHAWAGSSLPSVAFTHSGSVWTVATLDNAGAGTMDTYCAPGQDPATFDAAAASTDWTGGPIHGLYTVGGTPTIGATYTCAGPVFVMVSGFPGYYLLGPAAPPSTGPPARWVEQTISCTHTDGTVTTSTLTGPPSDFAGTSPVAVAGLMCPSGTRPAEWSSTLKTTGGSDLPLGHSKWPATTIPDGCYVTGASCVLRLQQLVSGTWTTCSTGVPGPCAGWMESPNPTQDYRCQLGSGTTWGVVPLSSCSTLARAFDPSPTSAPFRSLAPAPADGGCDTGGWASLLDGSIVYKAVSCALKWAFVPDAATLQDVQTQVSGAWSTTAPGQIVTAATAVGAPLRGLSSDTSFDCQGPEVDWSWGYLPHAHPFSTCEGLPHTLSLYFKPILGAVALLLALGQSVRILSGTISLPTTGTVA